MNQPNQYVVFSLDDQRLALRLSGVERVVWAVALTPLPEAPDVIPGVVNVEGRVMPVVDIRSRLGLPERALHPDHQFIIAKTPRRTVALWVDMVEGVIEPEEDAVIPAGEIVPGMGYIEGVVKLPEGVILIHDLDRFLSIEEEKTLATALERDRP